MCLYTDGTEMPLTKSSILIGLRERVSSYEIRRPLLLQPFGMKFMQDGFNRLGSHHARLPLLPDQSDLDRPKSPPVSF